MAFKTNVDRISPTIAEYRLPSGGLFYPAIGDKPFPETIKVKPFSFNTEAVLVTNLSGTDKMIAVLKDVAEFPESFDLQDLLVADQQIILAIARALTYNERYNFSSICPACEAKENHSLAVPDELPVKLWTTDTKKVASGNGAYINTSQFTFRMPVCQDTVELRFLSIADHEKARAYGEEAKKVSNVMDAAHVRRLAMHIKSINGTSTDGNWKDVEDRWLSKLRGADVIELKDKVEACSCGLVQNWNIECGKCKNQYKAYVPLRTSFFR